MKRNMISAMALACLALGLPMSGGAQTPGGGSAPVSGKVGVISVQGAIVGTKDGQKASQELDTKFVPKRKEFDSRQSELASLQDQYNKGGSVMSDDKRNQLNRDIDEKKKRLERDMQDAQEELQGAQQQVLQGLGQRMMAVIEKYAKDNGYTMILDVSNQNTPVLYASSAIDITQDIISLYDKNPAPAGSTVPTSTNVSPRQPGTPRTSTAGSTTPHP